MEETVRWTKALAAVFVCMSMLGGVTLILPGDVAAAPPEGYIRGNVNDGVTPLPGSIVAAMPIFGRSPESITFSDALGDYVLAVPGGLSYIVLAYNDSCYGDSDFAVVAIGGTAFVNFTLQNIAPAVTDVTLTGFVKDELGNPVADAMIGGYTADPSNMGGGPPLFINMTRTDGLGQFVVDVLPSFAGGGVVALGVPGYPFSDNSTQDPFVSGNTYWLNLTLKALSYNDDATVSGTVTDIDSGLPIENVMVMYESWNETTQQSSSNMTWTDSNGNYFMNVTSGWARVIMTRSGYSMFIRDNFEVSSGEDVILDVSLKASNAVVRGNVTELGSGVPIYSARVFVFDQARGIMNMAMTNPTGAYVLEAFDGTDLVIGAEADGYGRQFMMISIDPGDELWVNFELAPIDASVSGKVTDAISGLPIWGATIHFSSMAYEDWDDSDAAGDYSMNLVSGDYQVEVSAGSYRYKSFDVTISPGPNIVDIELMPWDIPDTVRMYGYVNDSHSLMGIGMASVEVGLGPPDYSERNMTSSDSTGFYEIYIPPVEMIVVVYASDHTHIETTVDGSGLSEIRMDFLLDRDIWWPNTTYSQNPLENVSFSNPTWIHVESQELDAKFIALWQFMKNGSGSGWDYYYAIEMLYENLNPLDPQGGNLMYYKVGDTYYVDYVWAAQPMCGWLTDGVSELYLPYYEVWWGPDMYIAWKGQYVNSSMMSPEQGTAWFDGSSGQFAFFTFDNGFYQTATPHDPTGVITAFVNMIQVMHGTSNWWWIGTMPMEDWSVVDLMFIPDWRAPSGDYGSLYFMSDWGDRGMANFTLYTVDNDFPYADAGPGQEAVVGTTVTLDGGMSSDNVGITTYMWTFDDGGPVTLFGEVVDYEFTTVGNHTVTLTVWDGALHASSATTWVNVLEDALPVADAGPDQEVPINTVVYFDGSGSWDDVGIVNFTWTIVELMENIWGPDPEFSFSVPGVYHVSLVVEDTAGQKSLPDVMQVTAKDVTPPVANAGSDLTEMGGIEIVLSGAASWDDVGIVNWTWTFEYMGSPVTLWGETVNFTFWVEGVYDITLNVTDAAGNWDTDEVQVTIAGIIPEFSTVVLPVTGVLMLVMFAALRRRRF